jgi:2-amino-4-hydroxy-6-hydroxymethyldihydropteridine diphosphokinase
MFKAINQAVIVLGGNIGDTVCMFQSACRMLEKHAIRITAASALFKSEPWGHANQRAFLNQAILVDTELSPDGLLNTLQTVERCHGKATAFTNGPRTLDMDIVFYDQLVMETERLSIPHPRAHLRRFNLEPLVDLVPYYHHPVLDKTVKELLEECEDPLNVNKINC